MRTPALLVAVLLAGGLLAACGEREQTLKPEARRNAAKPWDANSGPAAFVAPGWKVGDETSWKQQLQSRTQYGQNEYNRASAAR